MDDLRFDAVTRSFSEGAPRRVFLHALSAVLGLSVVGIRRDVRAKKGKAKNRKKKAPAFNAFGCLNIGAKCRGNAALCCSGICQGKKAKKGKKDKSKCVAHNTSTCTLPSNVCFTGSKDVSTCNTNGICTATTGNAPFCANLASISPSSCRACSKDQDCEALGFGLGSACVVLTGGACDTPGSNCAGVNDSNGTACLPAKT